MSTLSGPGVVAPVRLAAPGWYPAPRELRWWDGERWTEHRAAAPAYVVPAAAAGPALPRTSGFEVAVAWMATVLTVGYLLPWAVAATRGTRNSPLVAVVNLLLGWTVLGWLAALAMACLGRRSAPRVAAALHVTTAVAPALPPAPPVLAPSYAAPRALPPAPPRIGPPATLPLPVDLEDTAPLYGLRDHRDRD